MFAFWKSGVILLPKKSSWANLYFGPNNRCQIESFPFSINVRLCDGWSAPFDIYHSVKTELYLRSPSTIFISVKTPFKWGFECLEGLRTFKGAIQTQKSVSTESRSNFKPSNASRSVSIHKLFFSAFYFSRFHAY